jgi:hypothetical protein
VFAQEGLEPAIAAGERDAMSVLLLLEQREEDPQRGRQVLLDRRGNHLAHLRARLDVLDALVERRQHDDDRRPRRAQRCLQLTFGVDRVEGYDDRAGLPRAEFGHEELGAVRQQERDTVAWPYAVRGQRRGKRVAPRLEIAI